MFTDAMLQIKGVTKTFYQKNKEVSVVRDLTLQVKKGQVFGFLGVNGAGKTTTLKMIVGLLRADKGTITINGVDSSSELSRSDIGFMPETPQFYRHLKVIEVLKYVASLFEEKLSDAQAQKLLQQVGLADSANIATSKLSKGMHQRLAFSVALVNNPKLLILDEPLDGLDPVGRLAIKKLILDQKKKGTTVFFSSHILSDVEELCDELAIINTGELIAQGTPNSFIKKTKKSLEEIFVELVSQKKYATKN